MEKLSADVPTTEYPLDLQLPPGADELVREALDESLLRAYHATRLLDHELDLISSAGLRAFSRDLFEDRIIKAFEFRQISSIQRDELLDAHMYATGEQHSRGEREGQVCVILGDHVFDDNPRDVAPLLSNWGGEGIYFSKRGLDMKDLLGRLGRPTIVVLTVQVMPSAMTQRCSPELARALVGAWRGLRGSANLFHEGPIPGVAVEHFWQPGDSAYERFARLPSS